MSLEALLRLSLLQAELLGLARDLAPEEQQIVAYLSTGIEKRGNMSRPAGDLNRRAATKLLLRRVVADLRGTAGDVKGRPGRRAKRAEPLTVAEDPRTSRVGLFRFPRFHVFSNTYSANVLRLLGPAIMHEHQRRSTATSGDGAAG